MQALHEAGDALLQAVDGVVLRVMATEAVSQAAEGVSNKLQVAGLWARMRRCWRGSVPCYHTPTARQEKQGRASQDGSCRFEGGGGNCGKLASTEAGLLFTH